MNSEFVSNEQIVRAARRNLAQGTWDSLVGGTESETTMRRNRAAFDRIAFRPRVLIDMSSVDPSTTFLGHRLRIPVMLAPIGSMQVFTPEGGVAAAKAAAEFGTMQVVASVTGSELEEIAASAGGPKVFQLYVHGDWAWTEDIIARVKQAGYMALCLTVDSAHYSRRERPMTSGWAPPTGRRALGRSYLASLTWETMDRIKELAGLPSPIGFRATRVFIPLGGMPHPLWGFAQKASRQCESPFDRLRANGGFKATFVVRPSNHGPADAALCAGPPPWRMALAEVRTGLV